MLLDRKQELERIPNVGAVNGFGGAGDQDATDGGGNDHDGRSDKLAEQRGVGCARVTGPITLA